MPWRQHIEELLRFSEEDQAARAAFVQARALERESSLHDARQEEDSSYRDAVSAVDSRNRAWLREKLDDERTWPTLAEVGLEAARAAWILAQHADDDPGLQQRCLDLMTALPPHEANQFMLAALTDRVLLKAQGKQRFGTQWEQHDGKWTPLPLESPEPEVDRVRAEIGLESLAEYREVIAQRTK